MIKERCIEIPLREIIYDIIIDELKKCNVHCISPNFREEWWGYKIKQHWVKSLLFKKYIRYGTIDVCTDYIRKIVIKSETAEFTEICRNLDPIMCRGTECTIVIIKQYCRE